jgi:hypothetical protein
MGTVVKGPWPKPTRLQVLRELQRLQKLGISLVERLPPPKPEEDKEKEGA